MWRSLTPESRFPLLSESLFPLCTHRCFYFGEGEVEAWMGIVAQPVAGRAFAGVAARSKKSRMHVVSQSE
jgi:hypothetical protein